MIRVNGLIKIRGMAAVAGVGGIGIIALVTGVAIIGDGHVRACERINGVVVKR